MVLRVSGSLLGLPRASWSSLGSWVSVGDLGPPGGLLGVSWSLLGASSGAPKNDKLDITKYLSEFGEKKFISMGKGLDETIEWQKMIYGT